MGPAVKRAGREEVLALTRDTLHFFRYVKERKLAWGRAPGDSLEKIAAEVAACSRCRLSKSRARAVPGEGPIKADLVVIGEGPGSKEDQTGRPFVGEAGQMLTNMLEKAVGEPRGSVFITNIVKCRPPNNRDPEDDETAACRPFLDRQLALIKPLAILCLGRTAARNLLGTSEFISRLRGKVFPAGGFEIIPTFHPAYLLRNPGDKKLANLDLKLLKARLAALREAKGKGGGPK